mgnify:CR=1 FL=1
MQEKYARKRRFRFNGSMRFALLLLSLSDIVLRLPLGINGFIDS